MNFKIMEKANLRWELQDTMYRGFLYLLYGLFSLFLYYLRYIYICIYAYIYFTYRFTKFVFQEYELTY